MLDAIATDRKIDTLLVAAVLIIAEQMKARDRDKDKFSTSDYTHDAARLIREKRSAILALLAG